MDFSQITSPERLRFGQSPELDAWLLHFLTENSLEHAIDPEKNASPEQISFMVSVPEDQVFAPCSDRMLGLLLNNFLDPDLRKEYGQRWKRLVHLTRDFVVDRAARRRIFHLCRHKFSMVKASPIIIPSRLQKRFITMFLAVSALTDPYREKRRRANERAWKSLKHESVDRFLTECPQTLQVCRRMDDARLELDLRELERLFHLATRRELWQQDEVPDLDAMRLECSGDTACLNILRTCFGRDAGRELKILFLPEESGGLIFDLLLVRALLRQGHRVIMAVKDGFHFRSPVFWDWDHDPVLAGQMRDAAFIADQRMTKNELLKAQRENHFIVISDGTREELNLYRTSVTFARAWKEADLIIAKGAANRRRLLKNHHNFTRDVICFWRDAEDNFGIAHKPRPESVKKFNEAGLSSLAGSIIASMRRAKAQGKTVMFYSAVVGSIPGQTKTALRLLTAFVDHLRGRMDQTFIINPGEHFIDGMDADDLMYMWEKVQRSGLIDVWRFQTVEDIEKSFELLGEKVPPFWAGKDSTYSTGCTKEMRIALDVQKGHPEMQIIGPAPEKFFRRREYGVGKFFDAAIPGQ